MNKAALAGCLAAGLVAACGLGAGAAAPAFAGEAAPAPPAAGFPAPPSASPEEAIPPYHAALGLTELQSRLLLEPLRRASFPVPPLPASDAGLAVWAEAAAPGGVFRRRSESDLPVKVRVRVRAAGPTDGVALAYRADDFYGRKVAEGTLGPLAPDASGAAQGEIVLPNLGARGYYHVLVTAAAGGMEASAACGVAVVEPLLDSKPAESAFGLLLGPGRGPGLPRETVEAVRRVGIRHIAMDLADGRHAGSLPPAGAAKDWAPTLAWDAGDDAALDQVLGAGLFVTGIMDYGGAAKGAAAVRLYAAAGPLVVRRAAERIRDWQVLRGGAPEPAGMTAAECRELVAGAIGGVRGTAAPVRLWVGATPDLLADVLTDGAVLAGADGLALAPGPDPAARVVCTGAFRRSVDWAVQTARRAGLRQAAVTLAADPAASPQEQAARLVMQHVLARAAGASRVYVEAGRGAPEPLASAAALAYLADLLEGDEYEGSPWGDVPLLESHLFAGRQPVVVVWSEISQDPRQPDRGLLVVEDGSGLEASDVVGRPVGVWQGARLIVPLGEFPVYLAAPRLSAAEVRGRLARVRVAGPAPATLWVRSIAGGGGPGRADVSVWIQSHRPYRQGATMSLILPPGWTARKPKRDVRLEPGEAWETAFECDVAADVGPGPYMIGAVAQIDGETVSRVQAVQVAEAPQRSIEVGAGLTDWLGVRPVVLADESGERAAEVRVAWDEEFLYVAAAVKRPRGTFTGGPFAFSGDAIQLGFGLLERADDDFAARGVGAAMPAGAVRDTDHLLAVTYGAAGPEVVRLRGPGMALSARAPGGEDPRYGPVPRAKAAIEYDRPAGRALYEAAIPMKELVPLKAKRGQVLRLAFLIGRAGQPPLEWARQEGVPEYLANPATFLPVSSVTLPCVTRWSLAGPAPKE